MSRLDTIRTGFRVARSLRPRFDGGCLLHWQSRAASSNSVTAVHSTAAPQTTPAWLQDLDVGSLPDAARGRVMSSQANYYRVRLESDGSPRVPEVELLCKMRSLLRKKGAYVLVGDYVEVINIDWRDARALVSRVEARQTEIMDPKVANVNHFALVFSLLDPPFEPFQATRFLVAAESVGIDCSLILNKKDLVSDRFANAEVERIQEWGYDALPISVVSGQGLEQVRDLFKDRVTVLAGPSGVGKSSIINQLREVAFDEKQASRLADFQQRMDTEYDWRLMDDGSEEGGFASDGDHESDDEGDSRGSSSTTENRGGAASTTEIVIGAASGGSESGPGQGHQGASSEQAQWKRKSANIYGAQAVGNVGLKSKRGRHTTRSAILLDMPGGGLLVDTPGFNYPAMHQVTTQDVATYFPEIERIQSERPCQFKNCQHTHEPDCSVRNQFERYEFYVRVRSEVADREEVEKTKLQMQKRRRQGMTKVRKGKGGVDEEVARLDPKAHRRTSRNARKLQVRQLLEDVED